MVEPGIRRAGSIGPSISAAASTRLRSGRFRMDRPRLHLLHRRRRSHVQLVDQTELPCLLLMSTRLAIEPAFSAVSVEGNSPRRPAGRDMNLTDRQALRQVLEQNRYLVRQLCWVMTVGGLETYIVVPRDPTDWNLLVETLRPNPRPGDVDLVVGMRGPLAPPDMCNGLVVPVVAFDQLYSFDRDSLIASIPRPERVAAERFRETAGEVLDRIMQMTDNAGATDEHRALNYLTVRYPAIYAAVAQAQGRNSSLTAVDVRPSALSGVRNIVEVIFSFTDRATDVVEKQFLRVDVTEEFPFLVTKLSPYYDR